MIESYGPITPFGERLWLVDSEWQNTGFKRRMTILGLASGELVIHSAVQLLDEDYARLDELGRVAAIVVPNSFHDSEAHYYAERYPTAPIYAPADLRKQLVKRLGAHAARTRDLALEWPYGQEIDVRVLAGLRYQEAVLFHRPSRALVVADLVFHCDEKNFYGLERRLMRWNGVFNFGPSALFRKFFTRDPARLRESLAPVLGFDIERVVMSHGTPLKTGGRAAMARAFDYLN